MLGCEEVRSRGTELYKHREVVDASVLWERRKISDYFLSSTVTRSFYLEMSLNISLPCWLRWQGICLQCRRPVFHPLGWEEPLEKEMATHSSILAWRIPWTEEPGRVHSPWGRKEWTGLSDYCSTRQGRIRFSGDLLASN